MRVSWRSGLFAKDAGRGGASKSIIGTTPPLATNGTLTLRPFVVRVIWQCMGKHDYGRVCEVRAHYTAGDESSLSRHPALWCLPSTGCRELLSSRSVAAWLCRSPACNTTRMR